MTDNIRQDDFQLSDAASLPPPDAYEDYPPPMRTRRSGSGCGCWVVGLLTLIVAGALGAVALLLPPFSLYDRLLGPQYVQLSADDNAAADDGLTIAVYGPDFGTDFAVAIESMPMNAFLSGTGVPASLAQTPPNRALQSPVYTVMTRGGAPAEIAIAVDVPAAFDPDLLDLFGWDEQTGWRFLPARYSGGQLIAQVEALPQRVALFQAAPPDQPRVLVAVDVTQMLTEPVAQTATIVAPAGLQPTLTGSLTGSLAPGFNLTSSYLVVPSIRNYSDPRATDPETIETLLSNRALRAEHAEQVAAFASAGYDGVLIDYRDLPAALRDDFTAFMREVRRHLAGTNLLLGVVVPAPQAPTDPAAAQWDTGAYDWRALGQIVDLMQVNLPSDPRAFAPGADRPVEALLRWAVGEVSRDKLLLGLSALSVREVGGVQTPIGYAQALSALGDVRIDADMTEAGTIFPGTAFEARLDGFAAEVGRDPITGQPYIDYLTEQGDPAARMWLGLPDAVRYRMDSGLPFAVGGVAFEDLLAPGIADGVLEVILSYKIGLPAATEPRELALRWTIEGTDGVIDEVITGLNEGLIATIEAPDGNYAINVAVIERDAGDERTTALRGGAAVAMFAPTRTPTPQPTPTPTPLPEPTSTPNLAAAAAAQQVAAAPPPPAAAVRPGAGSIVVGNFEYGGHVTSTGTAAAEQMRRAGMNWMKIQLPYGRGASPSIAAGPIAEAHSRGFRILLGIVGNPAELAEGGQAYLQEFASFLGGVAALGPDAIEVWNEPNLDREWPQGQISGTYYADMLRLAYQAIKGANSGVMVISGAPAPTGAEAAFPGRVMNDDRWLTELVAAGGLNYMDCVGAHYNEGIVSPSQVSGDPRDNYYTRYFNTLLNTYWNIVGGQRPICFTELGYLSPEGYPPLPPFFSWAQNVTVAQQAAWLAEAAALASQSGRVRLMIVWNVDFTHYGADPMAGYAMIRPGGGCPACDALAGAR